MQSAGKGVFCGFAGLYFAFAGSVALPFSLRRFEDCADTREILPLCFCPAEEEADDDDEEEEEEEGNCVPRRGSSEVLPSNPRGARMMVAPGLSLRRSGKLDEIACAAARGPCRMSRTCRAVLHMAQFTAGYSLAKLHERQFHTSPSLCCCLVPLAFVLPPLPARSRILPPPPLPCSRWYRSDCSLKSLSNFSWASSSAFLSCIIFLKIMKFSNVKSWRKSS